MNDAKTSLSQADSYEAIGEFWDAHDLSENWDKTQPAQFDLANDATLFPVERSLSEKLRAVARRQGVSAETLLNLWVQEKVAQEAAFAVEGKVSHI